MSLIIWGVDPSLSATGIFNANSGEAETIKTKLARGDYRLNDIAGRLDDLIAYWLGPSFFVLEDLPISARAAGKTGMAHGVIRATILDNGYEYITLPPATLKKAATGNGRAEKADMINGYAEAYPNIPIADDNQADAAWLAECGKAFLGVDHRLKCPEALDKYMDRVPMSLRRVAA